MKPLEIHDYQNKTGNNQPSDTETWKLIVKTGMNSFSGEQTEWGTDSETLRQQNTEITNKKYELKLWAYVNKTKWKK